VLFCFSLVLCAPLSRGAAEGWGVKTSHDSGKGVVTREQILINPPVLRTSPFEKGEHSWNIAFPLCFALHFQGELPKAEGLKNITNWQRGYNKRTDIDKFPLSCGHPPLKRGSIVGILLSPCALRSTFKGSCRRLRGWKISRTGKEVITREQILINSPCPADIPLWKGGA